MSARGAEGELARRAAAREAAKEPEPRPRPREPRHEPKTIYVEKAGGADPGYWNFIMGALVVMFVIFITAKGRLPTYIKLFLYVPPAASTTSSTTSDTTAGAPKTVTDLPKSVVTGPAAGFDEFKKMLDPKNWFK